MTLNISSFAKRALPFSIIAAELLLAGIMIFSGRIIVRHDALQYMTLQYYFLNHSIVSGDVPLWLPFMMQGSSSPSWWFCFQGSLLQHALLLAGTLLPKIPFLTLFYSGFFVDTLLFLTGVWLLARRFFQSPQAVFVVTVSATGSLVWVMQPWFNFHFIFAVPMILHCLHSLLETGRWRYLALASSLFVLQLTCTLFYQAPVISLVIFLYFLFYAAFNLRDIREQWDSLRWGPGFWGALVFSLILLVMVPVLAKTGTGGIVLHSFGRSAEGTAPLAHFLADAAVGPLGKDFRWLEFFLGVSPGRDYTLYIGILTVFFSAIGFLNLRRRCAHFPVLALVMLAFGMGTWISTFFYFTWPLMRFFRYLDLTTCFVKLFLCFMAGLGFEYLFIRGQIRQMRIRIPLALLWGLLGIFLISLKSHPHWVERIFAEPFFPQVVLEPQFLFRGARRAGCIALAASAALFCLAGSRPRPTNRSLKWLAALFLILHLLDLYSYKIHDALVKTNAPNPDSRELVRFQPLPYPPRRSPLTAEGNLRMRLLYALQPRDSTAHIMQSFFFHDEPGSFYRATYWERPLDHLLKALSGQRLDDPNPPAGYDRSTGVTFPNESPAALKIAGVQEDKIQFFSGAYFVSPQERLAEILRDRSFGGDLLFLAAPSTSDPLPGATGWTAHVPLSTNQRLRIPYRVERFDSNQLELSLETPPSDPAWLYYSDVWHPFWKATVDGMPVPVLRAHLAYKAIPIKPGTRQVHFRFHSPALFLERLLALNALFWLVLLIVWTAKLTRETEGTPNSPA